MFTIFLLGNIASGKSTAAHYMQQHSALCLDLDEMAKSLYQPGSLLVENIALAFGREVLNSAGGIDRAALAARAFATLEDTERLNALVHPILLRQLSSQLRHADNANGAGVAAATGTTVPTDPAATPAHKPSFVVVEVSAPQGFDTAFSLASAVLAITAPLKLRRARALARGMAREDFDRRASVQLPEDKLCAMADVVIKNTGTSAELFCALDAYLQAQGLVPASQEGKAHA